MKTPSNQARRNGSARRPVPQVQTHRKPTKAAVNGSATSDKYHGTDELPNGGASLAFFSSHDDTYIADVPITAQQLAVLNRHAAASGSTLEDFILHGLKRTLDGYLEKIDPVITNGAALNDEKYPWSPLDELEEAINQFEALQMLLLNTIQAPTGGEWSDKSIAGFQANIFGAEKRLRQAAVRVNKQIVSCIGKDWSNQSRIAPWGGE